LEKIYSQKMQKGVITKDDFEKFISARYLARSGEYDQAIELSKSLENKVKQNLVKKLI